MFNTNSEIYQFIVNDLNNIQDKDWIMITLNVKRIGVNNIALNGEYINNIGDTVDIFRVWEEDNKLYKAFEALYQIMTQKTDKHKWNKLKITLIKDEDLNIKFEWDQELADEYEMISKQNLVPKEEKIVFKDELEVYDYFEQALNDSVSEEWKREDWDPLFNWLEIIIDAKKINNNIIIEGKYYNLDNQLKNIDIEKDASLLKLGLDSCYTMFSEFEEWQKVKIKIKNKKMIHKGEVFINKDSFYLEFDQIKIIHIQWIYDEISHPLKGPLSYSIIRSDVYNLK